jgi:hypothetical protein
MVAIPASTPEFYRTVRDLLVSYNATLRDDETQKDQIPLPMIPALTPLYSKLSPGERASQIIVMSSPWIDLGSPDPVVAELSRQVFTLEIAYVAFCGVRNVVIPGPNLTHGEMCVEGFSRFSRAIQEALVVSNYINFQILLPMAPGSMRNISILRTKMENISIFANPKVKYRLADDEWGSWEAWNLIRSVCNYNQRLSVGKYTSGWMDQILTSCSAGCPKASAMRLGAIALVLGVAKDARLPRINLHPKQVLATGAIQKPPRASFSLHAAPRPSLAPTKQSGGCPILEPGAGSDACRSIDSVSQACPVGVLGSNTAAELPTSVTKEAANAAHH